MKWHLMTIMVIMLVSTGCGLPPILKDAKANLETHRASWNSQNLSDYMFVYSSSCLGPCVDEPIRVDVQNGEIQRATDAEGYPQPKSNFHTVDELFDRLQHAIEQRADHIDVTYNSSAGYPEKAFVDYRTETLDDEWSFSIMEHHAYLTPQGAYKIGLESARWWAGLVGLPQGYASQRMTRREYLDLVDDESNQKDSAVEVWVVAFYGEVDSALADSEQEPEFRYIHVVFDAVTLDLLSDRGALSNDAARPLRLTGNIPISLMLKKAQADLHKHRALWDSRNLTDYAFRYSATCYGPCATEPIWIDVKEGVIRHVTNDEGEHLRRYDFYIYTVDKLFHAIQRFIDECADHVEVTYDPVLGHPMEASVDRRSEIVGEEWSFTISALDPRIGARSSNQ